MEFSRVLFRSLSSWAGRLCTGVSCAQGSQSVRRGCKTLEGERVEELPPPQERALGAAERCFVAHRIPMGLARGLLTRDAGARARIVEVQDGCGLETPNRKSGRWGKKGYGVVEMGGCRSIYKKKQRS